MTTLTWIPRTPRASLRRRCLPLALAACLLPTLAGATAAHAASATGWAFLYDDQPTNPQEVYYPPAADQGNSTGAANGVTRLAPGDYLVRLFGLGGRGGTVQVTAENAAQKVVCASGGFEPGTFDGLNVSVRCVDAAGSPIDTPFYASYVQTTHAAGRYAYAPGAAGTTFPARYTFTTGGRITVTHLSAGLYQIDLRRLASRGGTVTATAVSSPQVFGCNPVSWRAQGTAERVFVVCTDTAGTPSDVPPFTLTFADHTSLFGDAALPYAYALAGRPTTAHYTADAAHSATNSGGGRPSIVRLGTGSYSVTFPRLLGVDDVNVRATGGPARSCQVAALVHDALDTNVQVLCFDSTGAAADATYVVQLVGRPLP